MSSDRTIFDATRVRVDPSPARHDESTFDFYSRCSNPVIGSVRDMLELWFTRYPPGDDRRDLLGKFRDGDRRQFGSAAWELYIHESLSRQGFDVKPNPRLVGTPRRIDFLATNGADRLYVECTIVTHSDDDNRRLGGIGALEAAIDDSGILDYWLDLQFDERGPSPIPPDRFVAGLSEWVARQDIEALAGIAHQGHYWLPSFDWTEDGWVAHVWAIPRSPELRGRDDIRPLGIMSAETEEKAVWLALRAKLELKAEAYGDLDAPYIIAVNAPEAWPRDVHVAWAVYGPHAFEGGWSREGFLLRPDGPTYPGVSGVLGAIALQPHSFPRCWPTLYENPAAARRPPDSLSWSRIRVEDDAPVGIPGMDPPTLFGVAADWPGVAWP